MILLNMKNSSSTDEFSEWKTFHNIEYKGEFENSYRRRVFYENKLKMIEHNANPQKIYTMGLNQFSAMTDEEVRERFLTNIKDSS